MRFDPGRWRWQLARRLGPEAVAATLTAIAVLLVAALAWALFSMGS
jgi:hypothetical protein